MKNYIQPGKNITVTAAADVLSGAGVMIGKLFGVASGDALSGAPVTLVREGVFSMAKLSAQAWTVGQKIYWDDTAKLCTTVTTSNTLIGCAAAVAANPTAVGLVVLDGAIRV
jgi:predicted RecA/RadA family phage recombinase